MSSPPSPTRKRKESATKPIWRQDGFEAGLAQYAGARQHSSSDVDNCMSGSAVRNGVDPRASPVDSNSSATSECSDPADDCPFSPTTEPKRARSLSPQHSSKLVTMKRRASKSSFIAPSTMLILSIFAQKGIHLLLNSVSNRRKTLQSYQVKTSLTKSFFTNEIEKSCF